MLVGTDDGAIDEMHLPINVPEGIRFLLDGGQETVKDAGLAPAIEAAGHRAPFAVTFG